MVINDKNMLNTISKNAKSNIGMLLGSLLMSIGIYFFKMPNGFSTGGISGVSTVISGVFSALSPGQLMFIINAALLIVGFIFIGKETGAKTVVCTFAVSGLTWLFEVLFPLEAPLTDQPFLELAYAMLLEGIGSALIFNCNASSGGTDIIALILKKYTSLNVGNALLCTDLIVAISAFFVFGIEIGLFSLIGLFAKVFLIDSVIESFNICKHFMIITSKPEPIIDYILNEMNHSATTFDACGEYTQEKRKVVMTLCRRYEAAKLKQKIREIDQNAFVTIESTSDIIGKGFPNR